LGAFVDFLVEKLFGSDFQNKKTLGSSWGAAACNTNRVILSS
jgi:hypothetical protein